MKKIIAIIDCSIPINSRNQKIINSIKSYYPEYEIHVITWNREGLTLKEKGNFHAYYCIAPYADAKAKTKIKIICPKHGIFEQTPNNHLLSGHGCPKCRFSRGENKIRNFLQKNNILFEEQKRFKECKDERLLPFDFYLNNENILIEYQGIQHYKDAFGVGPEKFYKYKYHDFLKEEFAKKYGYNLITISYNDYNNIEQILSGLMIDKKYK